VFIKGYFSHFTYFFTHLRYRLLLALVLSLVVAVLDGFGIAMFLPLLQLADGNSNVDAEPLGNLRFLVDGLNGMGIVLSVYSVLVVIVVFFFFKGIARFAETYYKVVVRQYFIKKMRFSSIDRLLRYNYTSFVLADSGKIQNTLTGEVARVAVAYQNYMAAIQAAVMVFVYLCLAFLSNPEFALLVVSGGVISNLGFRHINRRTKDASKKITHDGHLYQGLLIQKVAYFKYLKATDLIGKFSAKLKEYVDKIEESNKKMGYYGAILSSAREPLVILVVVSVIIIQITLFESPIGLILLALAFFYRSLTFLMTLQTSWNNFLTNSGSLDNMTEFMEELKKGQEENGNKKITQFNASIELNHLRFSYGTKPVINGINLSISKNQTVAFVGESGSGKTTVVNLIAGLMRPQEGEVRIDGNPMSEIDIHSWRQKIGYITQEPVIFSDSIYNNVTFWAEQTEKNKRQFWRALEQAAIADFVRQLPMQENEELGMGGILVSGGQKQRLSIARELFKDADILIMDEATSSLDSETELAIQENIDALKGKYTMLIIAHRLATVKSADRIILMNQGEIVAEGDFDALMQKSERFNRMVALQEL